MQGDLFINGDKAGGDREEEILVGQKGDQTLSASLKKLRAVEFEIDAVTSAVAQLEKSKTNEDYFSDSDNEKDHGNGEVDKEVCQASSTSVTLQHALAADRLKSLIKTRDQLQKEFSVSAKDSQHANLIRDLIKEDPKPKRQLKKPVKVSTNQNKRLKTVSFSEDDDFDAVLTAATAGYVETGRDKSVRKGLLTSFHKLKGYERRIQEPGSANSQITHENVDKNDDLASSSIARAVWSMSEAAQACPKSMLLDPESLPRLDQPTHLFQRLRKPLKIPRSLEMGTEKDKDKEEKASTWQEVEEDGFS